MSNAESKRKVKRSPSFPVADLRKCIERIRDLQSKERYHATRTAQVFAHWGYTAKSGPAKRALAAVKAFGLAAATADMVEITELGKRILVLREGDPDWLEAVQKAALKPALHQKLWNKYGSELPSNSSLRSYLVLDEDFSDGAADELVRQYRETISFAKFSEYGVIQESTEESEFASDISTPNEAPEPVPPGQPLSTAALAVASTPAPTSGLQAISFPLPRGNAVEIRLRSKVTRVEFEQLKQLFELLGPSLIDDD